MFYNDLYPSQEIQENILKKLNENHILEFINNYYVKYFLKYGPITSHNAKLQCENLKFLKEWEKNVIVIHAVFELTADSGEVYNDEFGISLFNIFEYFGLYNEMLQENNTLSKPWIKFLKEKFPEYAPLLEEYKTKLTERVKENNEKRIKSAEQKNKESLEELNNLFTD